MEYWKFYIMHRLVFGVLLTLAISGIGGIAMFFLFGLYIVISYIPVLAISVRRMRDMEMPIILAFIPTILTILSSTIDSGFIKVISFIYAIFYLVIRIWL